MERTDKLSGRDPARAKIMQAFVHGEINRIYESMDE
jgi:hypothetical protein